MDLYDKFKHYGFEESLKDMIYLDHLIHNTDRHERNFGIIRNAETNEILRMAPIFDSGTCLNCTGMDLSYKNDCKPFFDNRYEQLDMLSTTDIRKRHNIDIAQIQQLIQDVYERFNIAETQYEKAIECIKLSHKELTEKSKTRIMEEPTI